VLLEWEAEVAMLLSQAWCRLFSMVAMVLYDSVLTFSMFVCGSSTYKYSMCLTPIHMCVIQWNTHMDGVFP